MKIIRFLICMCLTLSTIISMGYTFLFTAFGYDSWTGLEENLFYVLHYLGMIVIAKSQLKLIKAIRRDSYPYSAVHNMTFALIISDIMLLFELSPFMGSANGIQSRLAFLLCGFIILSQLSGEVLLSVSRKRKS